MLYECMHVHIHMCIDACIHTYILYVRTAEVWHTQCSTVHTYANSALYVMCVLVGCKSMAYRREGALAELVLEIGVPGDFNLCIRFFTDLVCEGVVGRKGLCEIWAVM